MDGISERQRVLILSLLHLVPSVLIRMRLSCRLRSGAVGIPSRPYTAPAATTTGRTETITHCVNVTRAGRASWDQVYFASSTQQRPERHDVGEDYPVSLLATKIRFVGFSCRSLDFKIWFS